MTASFTYFEAEDRLLLVLTPDQHKLWLTRRLTLSILQDIAPLFASQVPGEGVPGSGNAEERIRLEHRMAMDEEDLPDEREAGGSIRFSATPPVSRHDPDIQLCTGLDASASQDHASIGFVSGQQTVTLRLSRPGFHRLLRTLLLCTDKANWHIPSVPAWLRLSLLPDVLTRLPPLDEPDHD